MRYDVQFRSTRAKLMLLISDLVVWSGFIVGFVSNAPLD